MGILNCTPDSFFDGDPHACHESLVKKGVQLAKQGAHIIDVGGESSRPNSLPVSAEVEIRRTIPVIEALAKRNNALISIDTYKPQVAKAAIEAGAGFINDITGFCDPEMRKLAKEYDLPICVMHMQKSPETMQDNPFYPKGVVTEVYNWFAKRTELLLSEGIQKERIYLDVGIGFGKSVDDNLMLLKNIKNFHKLGFKLLIGLSRKSFMQKILNKPTTDLLSTTLALNTMSLLEGVEILRVHDVQEHHDILMLLNLFG